MGLGSYFQILNGYILNQHFNLKFNFRSVISNEIRTKDFSIIPSWGYLLLLYFQQIFGFCTRAFCEFFYLCANLSQDRMEWFLVWGTAVI